MSTIRAAWATLRVIVAVAVLRVWWAIEDVFFPDSSSAAA